MIRRACVAENALLIQSFGSSVWVFILKELSVALVERALEQFCVFFIFRVRATSSVSKSVSVLDLSGKEKPAKPPRRLSIPAKTTPNPAPRPPSNITPISEVRVRRAGITQRKPDTPVSDVSKSSSRKKFSVLSSSSYWISQIMLSEAAAKHSISLGFFKLAVEAGCEVY